MLNKSYRCKGDGQYIQFRFIFVCSNIFIHVTLLCNNFFLDTVLTQQMQLFGVSVRTFLLVPQRLVLAVTNHLPIIATVRLYSSWPLRRILRTLYTILTCHYCNLLVNKHVSLDFLPRREISSFCTIEPKII